ncbi:MAG TPA: hypothetical protein VEI02_02520 [Planctomycetota bacterium]|nr:hypothetical protein [Planctomycetota bacterium]
MTPADGDAGATPFDGLAGVDSACAVDAEGPRALGPAYRRLADRCFDVLATLRGGLDDDAVRAWRIGRSRAAERRRFVALTLCRMTPEQAATAPPAFVAESDPDARLERVAAALARRGVPAAERRRRVKDARAALAAPLAPGFVWVDRSAAFERFRSECAGVAPADAFEALNRLWGARPWLELAPDDGRRRPASLPGAAACDVPWIALLRAEARAAGAALLLDAALSAAAERLAGLHFAVLGAEAARRRAAAAAAKCGVHARPQDDASRTRSRLARAAHDLRAPTPPGLAAPRVSWVAELAPEDPDPVEPDPTTAAGRVLRIRAGIAKGLRGVDAAGAPLEGAVRRCGLIEALLAWHECAYGPASDAAARAAWRDLVVPFVDPHRLDRPQAGETPRERSERLARTRVRLALTVAALGEDADALACAAILFEGPRGCGAAASPDQASSGAAAAGGSDSGSTGSPGIA